MAIEVEIRSFISKEKYQELLDYFQKNAQPIKEQQDQTEYYADQGAVRIWQNQDSAKVILKSGDIHDEFREEHEMPIQKKDFPLFQKMFQKLNIPKQIRWQRKKHTFDWDGTTVELGDNKGYGYVIELEKLTDETQKEKALESLKEKLASLNIAITPKEEFDKAYENYKQNWKKLLEES